jgi:hypothetical protein
LFDGSWCVDNVFDDRVIKKIEHNVHYNANEEWSFIRENVNWLHKIDPFKNYEK